ncbi:phosphotransferase enzyme family protein [Burkholderia sp. 22PA0099]|uniref:phosphotransferase enzyme family protein n=1 Tax=Burkholderia sp. 22PA0099 TaxID=3237372 RepID=UPI0039C2828A
METLEPLLQRYWHTGPVRLAALPSGHTNKTFRLECEAGGRVLRVSWAGKPLDQVRREAAVLDHVRAVPGLPALPVLIPTVDGQPGAHLPDGRWLHLFEAIDGVPGLPADALGGTLDAMRTLAGLHAAMATLPAPGATPLGWLAARHARVAARARPRLPGELDSEYNELIRRIGAHLATATGWLTGPAHWLHGDYHAGNLLYAGNAVSGVLDFDDVGQGAHWLEAAFALFALSRDAQRDDRFVFDAPTWAAGLQAYAAARADAAPGWIDARCEALMLLFCADQTLIHLEAAQRGLWTPGAGMGFLGGWRQLMAD